MNTSKKLKIALLSGAATLALSLGALTACGGEEHDLTFVDEQAATCTEAGHEAYYLCSHCGKLFADENAETELSDADVTIAALGHNMTEHAAKDATCTADGNIAYWSCDRCDKNFSDKDGSKEVVNVVIPAGHDIDWVDLVEPTTSADGMLAHYECSVCKTCFEDANGDKEIEKADLTLAKLVEQAVTIKVEVYDTAGNKVASPDYGAISKQLTLKGAYSSNRYKAIEVKADGTLALDKIIVGDYEVDLYGYARSTFTVEKDNAAPTLKLQKTIAYGSNDKVTVEDKTASVTVKGAVSDYQSSMWSGSAELILSDELKESEGVVLEFNVKNVTNSQASGNDEWASQRIAVQMAKGYKGFLFFLPNGEANIFDMTDGGIRDEKKTRFGENGKTYAWIGALMRGDGGVNMRVVRTDDLVTLFVQNEDAEWVKIGAVECADAETDIILHGCGVEWKFSSIAVDALDFVAEKEATAAEHGNLAYYTDGTNYWFEDGTPTTLEGTYVYLPVDVTLTVKGIALDGKTAEAVAEGTLITFTSRAKTYTYTVGGTALEEMVAGTYTVTAEGYRAVELPVPTTGGAIELTLQKVISIAGKVEDYTSNKWSDSFTLDISEELKASTAVILEFNVRNVTNSQAAGNDEWASQRIAIQMAKGNEGFLFFLPKGEANVFDMTDNGISDGNKTRFGESGAALSWIDTLMRGVGGVNMRIVRTGANATLFVQNEKAEWVKIGTVACGDAETEIVFYGCGVEWAFSSITAEEIEYVAQKDPVVGGADGNVEYYTDGTNYWLADGSVTTAEDVVLSDVEVKLTVAGLALDGKTEATIAEGTVITLTGAYGNYTFKMGEAAPTQMLAATYTVTAEGYAQTTLVVPKEGGDITLTLKESITIGKGAVTLTGGAWNDQEKLAIPEELTDGDFVFEATLKMRDFTQGFNDYGAWQRYAIRLTKGNAGFYFWSWNDGTAKTHIRQFGENNLTGTGENASVNADEAGLGYITNALLSEDGLRIRITREGTTFTLEVMKDDAWTVLGTVTCAADDVADIELYAGVGTYEWSNVTVTPVEAQEPAEPEAPEGQEPEGQEPEEPAEPEEQA